MKQHITVEQLNELSEEDKAKLREQWEPRMGDVYVELSKNLSFGMGTIGNLLETNDAWIVNPSDKEIADKFVKIKRFPLLSIGQMIEFLGEFKEVAKCEGEWDDTNREEYSDLTDEEFDLVKSQGFIYQVYYRSHNSFVHHPVLCDALWEAVKYTLNKYN